MESLHSAEDATNLRVVILARPCSFRALIDREGRLGHLEGVLVLVDFGLKFNLGNI